MSQREKFAAREIVFVTEFNRFYLIFAVAGREQPWKSAVEKGFESRDSLSESVLVAPAELKHFNDVWHIRLPEDNDSVR